MPIRRRFLFTLGGELLYRARDGPSAITRGHVVGRLHHLIAIAFSSVDGVPGRNHLGGPARAFDRRDGESTLEWHIRAFLDRPQRHLQRRSVFLWQADTRG